MGNGFASGGFMIGLFHILAKILFVVFATGFIVGIVIWIRDYMLAVNLKERVNRKLIIAKNTDKNESCISCGKELDHAWKVCPYCAKEVEVKEAVIVIETDTIANDAAIEVEVEVVAVDEAEAEAETKTKVAVTVAAAMVETTTDNEIAAIVENQIVEEVKVIEEASIIEQTASIEEDAIYDEVPVRATQKKKKKSKARQDIYQK